MLSENLEEEAGKPQLGCASCTWYMHIILRRNMSCPFIRAPIAPVYFPLFCFLAFPVYGERRPPASASGLFGGSGSAGSSGSGGGGRGIGKSGAVAPSKVATNPVHSIPWLQLLAAVLEAYPAGGCWRPKVRNWCCAVFAAVEIRCARSCG